MQPWKKKKGILKPFTIKRQLQVAILKFVASYENGKAAVGLQHINPEHDFYHLYSKDNIVLFYTNRYTEQPMVVKGASAGAEVTASGVFADIMGDSALGEAPPP